MNFKKEKDKQVSFTNKYDSETFFHQISNFLDIGRLPKMTIQQELELGIAIVSFRKALQQYELRALKISSLFKSVLS